MLYIHYKNCMQSLIFSLLTAGPLLMHYVWPLLMHIGNAILYSCPICNSIHLLLLRRDRGLCARSNTVATCIA